MTELSDTEMDIVAVARIYAAEYGMHRGDKFIVEPEKVKEWLGTIMLLAARLSGKEADIADPVEFFDKVNGESLRFRAEITAAMLDLDRALDDDLGAAASEDGSR